ncbi:hypothetical protein PSPO01_15365 [Paraphaeosphaeria sporulosa]
MQFMSHALHKSNEEALVIPPSVGHLENIISLRPARPIRKEQWGDLSARAATIITLVSMPVVPAPHTPHPVFWNSGELLVAAKSIIFDQQSSRDRTPAGASCVPRDFLASTATSAATFPAQRRVLRPLRLLSRAAVQPAMARPS